MKIQAVNHLKNQYMVVKAAVMIRKKPHMEMQGLVDYSIRPLKQPNEKSLRQVGSIMTGIVPG